MRLTCLLPILAVMATDAPAAASTAGSRPLVVGTRHVPPFAMRDADGTWRGISIDLWRDVADQLQVRYEFREMTLPELLVGLDLKQASYRACAGG